MSEHETSASKSEHEASASGMEAFANASCSGRSESRFFVLGALFYYAALPPSWAWFLIFLVPVFWSVPIRAEKPIRLRTIYLTALFFWLASIWWISCPHPLTSLGLLALAGYLAIYWPLFFAACRIAVHRFRIPMVLAMPICWIGCEWLRNHLLGGFSFCSLEHALYLQPKFIQLASVGGGYMVGGLIMLAGAGVGTILASVSGRVHPARVSGSNSIPPGFFSAVFGLTALLGAVFYGIFELKTPSASDAQTIRVGVCQGNKQVRLDDDMEKAQETFEQYLDLTYRAVREAREVGNPIDLIVWPETVCPIPALLFEGKIKPEDIGFTDEQAELWREQLEGIAERVRTPILYGLSSYVFRDDPEPVRLNTAMLVDPTLSALPTRYDKVHLVMFGEYIPFSKYLPKNFFLKTLCQEAGRGTGPVAMAVSTPNATRCFSVNICFESTAPHFIRNQVSTLRRQSKEPDFLVNISNDGWFRFSRQIDQHLATHVFRAVENRKPYITATNGGFSATIDAKGRIQKIGTRGEAETIVADLTLWGENMPIYELIGDAPAMFCTALLVLLLFTSCFKKTENNSRNGA